jgi:hypothetical protein
MKISSKPQKSLNAYRPHGAKAGPAPAVASVHNTMHQGLTQGDLGR